MNKPSIKQWAPDDRPREKLFLHGEHRLSNTELLAVLLRTGIKGHSALDLARNLVERFGSLRKMGAAHVREWKTIKGLGPAKIAHIKAALELGKRVHEEKIGQKQERIQSAQDVADLLLPRMRDLKIEVFKVLYLDAQNRLIAVEEAASGTVNGANPIIREIAHKALWHYASAIICAHNHPSGSLAPSQEDKLFTAQLKQACEIMGIRFIDHLILAADGYASVVPGTYRHGDPDTAARREKTMLL
ncbi:MAG: DNA repair protein RadC [Candidatus Omnitrophica bacterium]|nr:DNA repair protein RadC [Candidatus Omnitrophota bacterium]